MAMLVTKTYLVDTNDVDEAYELTKPPSDKVGTFAVGQIRPFDPTAQPNQITSNTAGGVLKLATPPKESKKSE